MIREDKFTIPENNKPKETQQKTNTFTSYASILENFDLVILPVANPDGYEYSMTKVIFFLLLTK